VVDVTGLTAVSLFAGIGGFDLAMERAGVRTVAAVEIEPDCRGVLARHFPETALFGDVTEVTGDQLRAAGFVPERGIICGGWPCQGNSVAGRRGGMADPRSGLWRHVVRLLAEARPRWFIGENVPGLLSVNGGRDFGTVLGDLDDLGYGVAWRVLDAQWFGVPQRRRRVFIAAGIGDPCGPVQVLLEPEGGGGNPAAGGEARPDVAGTLGSRAGGSRTTDLDGHGAYVVSALQGGGRRGHRIDAEGAAGGHLIAFDAAQITSGENRANPQPGDPMPPLVSTGNPMVAQPMAFNPQTGGSKARLGYGPVPTALQAEQVTAVQAGTSVRRLTPRECERLQGLPDDWTRWLADGSEQSDSARYRQLGNAVAVPVAEWIARRVVALETLTGAEGAA
jgi:DNA (cytosine-5)-methyltransferase 1